MSDKIICKIFDEPKIKIRIFDEPKIICKFGSQGLKGDKGATGPAGTTNHALLSNLDFDNSGHIGFQKKLIYDPSYKAYLVE
jgi:hypothetical protein